jgi:hypothetical protein
MMAPPRTPDDDAAVVAWIETVLRHAASRAGQTWREHADHEMATADLAELAGPGPGWQEALIGDLDAAALCAHFSGREGVACRLLAFQGPMSERDLAARLGVSQPTAHRLKVALAVRIRPLLRP